MSSQVNPESHQCGVRLRKQKRLREEEGRQMSTEAPLRSNTFSKQHLIGTEVSYRSEFQNYIFVLF